MKMDTHISHEISIYRDLREQLCEEFSDIDDDTLNDTLEGISNLPDLVAGVLRSALGDRDLADALKSRIHAMKNRHERLEARYERKREIAREAMEQADMKRLTQPDFTVTLQAAQPALVVTDENEIPETYWVVPPARLDRMNLKAVLKSGDAVPGATLGNPRMTIVLRTS
jgi:hypothetical protein